MKDDIQIVTAQATGFVRRILATDQVGIRQRLVREFIAKATPEHTAGVCDYIIRNGYKSGFRDAYYCLLLALLFDLEYHQRQEIYRVCSEQSLPHLGAIILEHPPARTITDSEHAENLERFEMTLGERKARARVINRGEMDKVLFDHAPEVIELLLDNPKVTEFDVLRIASRRPTYAVILNLIIRHHRWGVRQSIQIALARNPYAPTSLAIALLPLLPRQEVKAITLDQTLHPFVCRFAREMIG